MASSVVKLAARQVGRLVVEEAKFLYGVKDKIMRLQTELEWIECFLEDADDTQHQDKLVGKWVAEITDFAYECEDIIERYVHQVPRQSGIWNTIKWSSKVLCACRAKGLHDLGEDIDILIEKLSELRIRMQTYDIRYMRPTESSTVEERWNYPHVEEIVVGFEKDVERVVEKLASSHGVKVISIIGMGGLGKSTLARKVFAHKDIKQRFLHNCVWVNVSKQFTRRRIFEDMLIGLRDKSSASEIRALSDEVLAKTIYELIQNERCLVVLDDIWTKEAWDNLLPALGSIRASSSTSKILLSTRNRELLEYVDSNGYPHYLEPLNGENSWKLLKLKANPQNWIPVCVNENAKKEKLGREMLQFCHGLPLAIITLGGILSSRRTFLDWEGVLRNITTYLMTYMGDTRGIMPVLELSYQDLPFYLKPCFLYLANFPEDHVISTQRLYNMWDAEGILSKDQTELDGITSYEIGERLILGLVQRSMIEVGKRWPCGRIKSFWLHDLIRDMCIIKCKETSFLDVLEFSVFSRASIFDDWCVQRKKIRRCAFYGKAESSSSNHQYGQIEVSSVRSVVVFRLESRESFVKDDLRKIVKSFPLLRVLDLYDAAKPKIQVVEVERLIHLRYLNMRGMYMKRFPSRFWNLRYLVSLDLRSPCRMEIPNKFHQMERLRHLYLPSLFHVKGGKRLTFKVDQMETLHKFDPKQCELKDLLRMKNLRAFSVCPLYLFTSKDDLKLMSETPLVNLQHLVNYLHLRIRAEVVEKDPPIICSLFNGISCFTKLSLQGASRGEPYNNLENEIARGVQVFPIGLTKIEIDYCRVGNEVILVLEKLPHLRVLRLRYVEMGEKLSFSAGSFTRLKLLHLSESRELEEWEVGDGALVHLERLRIFGCSKLVSLPNGLPQCISVYCDPCINGVEEYTSCPYFKPRPAIALKIN